MGKQKKGGKNRTQNKGYRSQTRQDYESENKKTEGLMQGRMEELSGENGMNQEKQKERLEREKEQDDRIKAQGQLTFGKSKIELMTIIGEIEGHENLNGTSKTTKYEHMLPQLAAIEENDEIQGVLILLNTMGGDVDAGLAIAEMIASLSKPTVSLVLGGSHSIGVPLAVATDYSFIVPTGTMLVHPVRMSGTMIGAKQTYDYFKKIQDRITGFVEKHSGAERDRLEELMMNTGEMTKDLGTILVGEEAIREGLINEVGGIHTALNKLRSMIDENTSLQTKNRG